MYESSTFCDQGRSPGARPHPQRRPCPRAVPRHGGRVRRAQVVYPQWSRPLPGGRILSRPALVPEPARLVGRRLAHGGPCLGRSGRRAAAFSRSLPPSALSQESHGANDFPVQPRHDRGHAGFGWGRGGVPQRRVQAASDHRRLSPPGSGGAARAAVIRPSAGSWRQCPQAALAGGLLPPFAVPCDG